MGSGKLILSYTISIDNPYTGFIARDEAKNEGVELLHAMNEGKNESRIRLERFDMVRKLHRSIL